MNLNRSSVSRVLCAVVLALAAMGVGATRSHANISLAFRPGSQVVTIGQQVNVGLYAVSDDETTQLLAAMQVIIQWDPAVVRLDGFTNNGAPISFSGFLTDPYGLNEGNPRHDGNGIFYALAQPG